MKKKKFEKLEELSVRLSVRKSYQELFQMDSLLEQLKIHTALELTKNVYYYQPTYEWEGKNLKHLSILKFFNAVIHNSPNVWYGF